MLLQAVYFFRQAGIPEEKIYAYYKSGGLFPCDINMDLLSSKELEEFHMDVMSAKSYFSAPDPYDEIDPALIAYLIIGLLSVLLLLEISSNASTEKQFRGDVNYLYQKNLQPKLSLCLSLANGDLEHQNEILDLLLKRIS